MDVWLNSKMNEWMDGWTNVEIDRCSDGWTDRWTDGYALAN